MTRNQCNQNQSPALKIKVHSHLFILVRSTQSLKVNYDFNNGSKYEKTAINNDAVFFHIKLCGNYRERLSKFWFKMWSLEGKFLVKNVVVGRLNEGVA